MSRPLATTTPVLGKRWRTKRLTSPADSRTEGSVSSMPSAIPIIQGTTGTRSPIDCTEHDQRLPDFARTKPFTCKCTWVSDHKKRVHMYLVVGFCKLGTTFCLNFEQQTLNSKDVRYQCIQLQVCCDCSENAFCLQLEEKKSVDFAWALRSDPRFTDQLLFKTVFFWTKGWSQKAVSTVLQFTVAACFASCWVTSLINFHKVDGVKIGPQTEGIFEHVPKSINAMEQEILSPPPPPLYVTCIAPILNYPCKA